MYMHAYIYITLHYTLNEMTLYYIILHCDTLECITYVLLVLAHYIR